MRDVGNEKIYTDWNKHVNMKWGLDSTMDIDKEPRKSSWAA